MLEKILGMAEEVLKVEDATLMWYVDVVIKDKKKVAELKKLGQLYSTSKAHVSLYIQTADEKDISLLIYTK